MTTTAAYLCVYFLRPIGEVYESAGRLLERLLALCPPLGLCHFGDKPAPGRFVPAPSQSMVRLREALRGTANLNPDAEIHCNFKDGGARTFVGTYHLLLWATNLVYFPQQRVFHPNFIQFYFPLERAVAENWFRDELAAWMSDAMFDLGGCYGYLNPVVMYDMYNVGRDNAEALALLAANPVLDLFDDFNSMKLFVDHVKGPMWLTTVGERHLSKLGAAKLSGDSEHFEARMTGDGLVTITLRVPLGSEPTPSRLAAYRDLGGYLAPISLEDHDPVMFQFPYRFRRKGAKEWVRRFVEELDTGWWPDPRQSQSK